MSFAKILSSVANGLAKSATKINYGKQIGVVNKNGLAVFEKTVKGKKILSVLDMTKNEQNQLVRTLNIKKCNNTLGKVLSIEKIDYLNKTKTTSNVKIDYVWNATENPFVSGLEQMRRPVKLTRNVQEHSFSKVNPSIDYSHSETTFMEKVTMDNGEEIWQSCNPVKTIIT